jgi:hypothetical protein
MSELGAGAILAPWVVAVTSMLAQERLGMAVIDFFLPFVGVVHGAILILDWIR